MQMLTPSSCIERVSKSGECTAQKRRTKYATDMKELAIHAPAMLRQFSERHPYAGRHVGEIIYPNMPAGIHSQVATSQQLNTGQKHVHYRTWKDVEHAFLLPVEKEGTPFLF
jgi:hypothetical protein